MGRTEQAASIERRLNVVPPPRCWYSLGVGGGIWGGCGHKEPVGCWRRSEGAAGGTACVAVSQVVPSIVVTPGDAISRRARDLLVTLSISGPGSK